MFNLIVIEIIKAFGFSHKWIEQNVVSYIQEFVRAFEQIIIILAVVIFLLIIVHMTLKHIKKLPKMYSIEIVDIYDREIVLDGLRVNFATHTAAMSYSQFYANLYGNQYKFKVVGRSAVLDNPIRKRL
jgi:hypothetical protein